jgi:hypothetical protein
MKKVLLSIAAAATLAAAAPTMAAPFGGFDHGYTSDYRGGGYGVVNVDQRVREISFRIDRGIRDGSLDWREARMLKGELSGVQRLQYRYMRGGLNGWERADLNARLDRLSFQVRDQRHDGDYRGRW